MLNLKDINLKPQTVEECHEVILLLVEQVKELLEMLNKNSTNSSKPSSTDIFKKHKTKKPSGKSRGGQPGHVGKKREMFTPTEIVLCEPSEKRCECGGKLTIEDKHRKHQVTDIPVITPSVTEYRIKSCVCNKCNRKYYGELPNGVPSGNFGPNLIAMQGVLVSEFHQSKRLIRQFFKTLCNTSISLGSVSNNEKLITESLKKEYTAIENEVKKSPVIYIDETGFKESAKRGWLWVAGTAKNVFFHCNASRGKKVAQKLLGSVNEKIICSDRFSAYSWIPPGNRQICHAHLLRDFMLIKERDGFAGAIGARLVMLSEKMFHLWHTTSFDKIAEITKDLQADFLETLIKGTRCLHKTTAATCSRILSLQESLWAFTKKPDVEPTNNFAERLIRPAVIYRKLSFGTQSDRGSRFIESILSVSATCSVQNRDKFEFTRKKIGELFSLPKVILT